MNLEQTKAKLRAAAARGSEYVTIYHKNDGETDRILAFFEENTSYEQMMQSRMFWKGLDYRPRRVYDLYYIDPDALEEV